MNEHDDLTEDLEATDAAGVVGGNSALVGQQLRRAEKGSVAASNSVGSRDASHLSKFANDQIQHPDQP